MSPLRWRRQARRSTSGTGDDRLHLAGCGLPLTSIVGQEDLLEARFVAGEIDHPRAGKRAHQRLEAAADYAAYTVVMGFDPVNPGRRADGVERHRGGELDLHLVEADVVQLVERSEERRVGKECRSRGSRYP